MSGILLASCILIVYGATILIFYLGWIRVKKRTRTSHKIIPVSILIAYRNEEKHLLHLLESLSEIQYADNSLELILCNDHSTDQGPSLLQALVEKFPFPLILLDAPDASHGKKQALHYASTHASGEILLLTDADGSVHPEWVRKMILPFNDEKIHLVQGPVHLRPNNTLISKLEQVEFMSLMMSAAGSIGWNMGILASGANIAVRQSAYAEAVTHLKSNIPTGDDMFLLEYIKNRHPRGVDFIADPKAQVTSAGSHSLRSFWNKRKRWSSKSLNYSDVPILLIAILVFLANGSILLCFLTGFFRPEFFVWALAFLTFKTLTEWPLMYSGIRFYQMHQGLKWFLMTQSVYPLYIVLAAIGGLSGNYVWKNRPKKAL